LAAIFTPPNATAKLALESLNWRRKPACRSVIFLGKPFEPSMSAGEINRGLEHRINDSGRPQVFVGGGSGGRGEQ